MGNILIIVIIVIKISCDNHIGHIVVTKIMIIVP